MLTIILVGAAVLFAFGTGVFVGYAERINQEWSITFTRLYGED